MAQNHGLRDLARPSSQNAVCRGAWHLSDLPTSPAGYWCSAGAG